MNNKLIENGYLIIPNFISSYRANKLCEEYKQYSEKNNLNGDVQAPNSHSSYNYISFLELLCEKTPEISEILEETVLPTYAYSRVYKNQSILKKHKDRGSCEISLTVHLGGDVNWEIFIKNPKGEDCCVNLNPGDAMLYLGTEFEHWREQYSGQWYAQVFLHYVKSRGEYFSYYFDKNNTNTNTNSNDNNKNNLDQQYKNDIVENNKMQENNDIEEYDKGPNININSSSKLENFIQVFDDVLLESDCDLILNEYKNSNQWKETYVANNILNRSIRNCEEISISSQDVITQNYEIRKKIDEIIFFQVSNVIKEYQKIFPSFDIQIDTGYQILKYGEGQYYKQHTDSFKEQQRSLSCSIQLNQDYEGGEFAFFDREIMIRTKPGSVIVFPSNFMYPHEIMPVIKGTRYSIITWLV
jgi:predicted 2-oxoglutarate/Fe(II)-dependent dioxygenase YbiX